MPQIQLDEQIFIDVQRRASAAGYDSVDEFVQEVLAGELRDDYGHFFTPDRVARLEEIAAKIDAGGRTFSMAEVQQHFEEKHKIWLANDRH